MTASLDSFSCKRTLSIAGKEYVYFSLTEAEKNGLAGVSNLPFSLKVLLENLLRFEDGRSVTAEDIKAVAEWINNRGSAGKEIAYRPARVSDAGFHRRSRRCRSGCHARCTSPSVATAEQINPLVPVDLVIDHSVMIDEFGILARFKEC